jgi:hypothetical protein
VTADLFTHAPAGARREPMTGGRDLRCSIVHDPTPHRYFGHRHRVRITRNVTV